jgi:hypothetical protein
MRSLLPRRAQFFGLSFLHRWTLRHASPVILDFWELSGVHSVSLQPLGQGEKVRVADRIGLAHECARRSSITGLAAGRAQARRR